MQQPIDIRFTIPGPPVAKGRPKVYSRKKKNGQTFTRATTPKKTETYEAIVASAAAHAFEDVPYTVAHPVRVELLIVLQRPKRLKRRKDPDGLMPAPVRPDADNVAKAVLDGMEHGGAWTNDCVVTDLHVRKCYSERTGKARVEVRVTNDRGPAQPSSLDRMIGQMQGGARG